MSSSGQTSTSVFAAGFIAAGVVFAILHTFVLKSTSCHDALAACRRTTRVQSSLSPLDDVHMRPTVVLPESSRLDVAERDERVVADPLYPPLARSDRPIADDVARALATRYQSRPDLDTFRLLGYLNPSDGSDNLLMLYGRSKDDRGRLGQFYVTTTDRQSALKLTLGQKNSNLRYMDDIPSEVSVTGDLLAGDYRFVELEKGDLDAPRYL